MDIFRGNFPGLFSAAVLLGDKHLTILVITVTEHCFYFFLEIIAYALRSHKEPYNFLKRKCLKLGLSMLFVPLGLSLSLSPNNMIKQAPRCANWKKEKREKLFSSSVPCELVGRIGRKMAPLHSSFAALRRDSFPSPFFNIHAEETGEVPFLLLFPHVCKRGTN